MTITFSLLAILASYLLGAVPFGYLVARRSGVDIFQQGSGNIGATNVGRVLGRRVGIFVFVLDFTKGAVPVAVATLLPRLHPALHAEHAQDWLPVLTGLAALLGHMFPVYLGFRGGKGVATGAGVVSVLVPGPALAALVTWVVTVAASRYISLASMLSALALCFFRLTPTQDPLSVDGQPRTWFCLVAAALVWVRHRSNIVRLVQGTESQVRWITPMVPKTVHALAIGLWFGSAAFLNLVVAPTIFHKFESLGARPGAEERDWLPLTRDFDRQLGTRLAGAAVAPLFDWFYPLEGACGLLVAITAATWSWTNPASRVHRLRSCLAALALATVVAGWPLALRVGRLRFERYSSAPDIAAAASKAFGAWHAASLLLGLVTLLLVTILMALAVRLPGDPPAPH